MGIFDKRKSIPSREIKSVFKKDTGLIPGSGGKKYYQREREKMAGQVFGTKYGSEISKNEYQKALRDLKTARKSAKTSTERTAINRKFDYLRRIGGKRI